MNTHFEIHFNQKQKGFYLRQEQGEFLLRSSEVEEYDSEENIYQDIERIRQYALNPSAFSIIVAGSGSYKFVLKDLSTGRELAKCGPFDSRDDACFGIRKVMECVSVADIVKEVDPMALLNSESRPETTVGYS